MFTIAVAITSWTTIRGRTILSKKCPLVHPGGWPEYNYIQVLCNGNEVKTMRGRIADYLECKNKSPLMKKKAIYSEFEKPKNRRLM